MDEKVKGMDSFDNISWAKYLSLELSTTNGWSMKSMFPSAIDEQNLRAGDVSQKITTANTIRTMEHKALRRLNLKYTLCEVTKTNAKLSIIPVSLRATLKKKLVVVV